MTIEAPEKNDDLYIRIAKLINEREIGKAIQEIRQHDAYRQLDILVKLSHAVGVVIDEELARPMSLDEEQFEAFSLLSNPPIPPNPWVVEELSICRPLAEALIEHLKYPRNVTLGKYLHRKPTSGPDYNRAREIFDAYNAGDLSEYGGIGDYELLNNPDEFIYNGIFFSFKRARVLALALDIALEIISLPTPARNILILYPRFILKVLESLTYRLSSIKEEK